MHIYPNSERRIAAVSICQC